MEDIFLKITGFISDTRFYWEPVTLLIILYLVVKEIITLLRCAQREIEEYLDE